jgi:hypothetical protein
MLAAIGDIKGGGIEMSSLAWRSSVLVYVWANMQLHCTAVLSFVNTSGSCSRRVSGGFFLETNCLVWGAVAREGG